MAIKIFAVLNEARLVLDGLFVSDRPEGPR